ncbi:MAG: SpvB/TcaC N-terminal domain-containing protein [Hyphomicrobiaceae bacterium]
MPRNEAQSERGTRTQAVQLGAEKAFVLGLSLQRKTAELAKAGPVEVSALVTCHEKAKPEPRVANVTAGCAAFSVLASEPITIGIPYDLGQLPKGVGETDIRLFKASELTLAGPMAPIESYLDLQNKQTVSTLSQQSGRFISAVLHPGERPQQPPHNLSNKTLSGFRETNPLHGVPIIAPPDAHHSGDLKLTYPFDLPGVRENFRPQISVGYSAQSGSGNIAVGWNLTVPMITVDTRWGVPVYDPNLETEVYLFNGEQLVPEAGDAFVDAQSSSIEVGNGTPSAEPDAADRRLAALHLVPQPHRTTRLRPRKTGKAHFVLRRDEGLWRFTRHGDTPAVYWWEAWQENPGTDVARVMYFGRAPGRLADDIEKTDLGRDMAVMTAPRSAGDVDVSTLRVGPVAGLADPNAIWKWGLAREKDSFGNTIDYDWVATCLSSSTASCPAGGKTLADRDLYLKRVIYTGHQSVEETILRCGERPDAAGCLRRQGLYELNLFWTPDANLDPLPLRLDARSGGLTVSRRLLERAEVRFRRRNPDDVNATPLHRTSWDCSSPFLGYEFRTYPDPLFPRPDLGRPGARRWLQSITKHASKADIVDRQLEEDAIFPAGLTPGSGGCGTFSPLVASAGTTSHASRFDYLKPAGDGAIAFGTRATSSTAMPSMSGNTGSRIDAIRSLIPGVSADTGPFAASKMGSVETESFNAGIYVGFGGPTKALSAGYKFNYSKRTSHKEMTLLLDIDGDGIPDVLVLNDGKWFAHRGKVDSDGLLSFKASEEMGLDQRFRFQHEPVFESTNSGFEAHVFGSSAGTLDVKSHSVQTVQLADMDGDGRVDIVTPAGVFYNTTSSTGGSASYRFTANTPFLLNGTVPGEAVAPVATAVPLPDVTTFPASAQHPRYDTVRSWRAPFTGLVRITGQIRLIAPDDNPDDVWGVVASVKDPSIKKEPLPDKLLPPANRDGVIATIERSKRSETEAMSCVATTLGARVLDRLPPPQPGGPGLWSLLGARVAPRDEPEGTVALDYRLSVTGQEALGPTAAKTPWKSSVIVKRAASSTAIPATALVAGLQAGVESWNKTYGKGVADEDVGALTATVLPGDDGVMIVFDGKQMPEMPPLRFTLELPKGKGLDRAALQLMVADNSGSVHGKDFYVDTRIVPRAYYPDPAANCATHPKLADAKAILAGKAEGLMLDVAQDDVVYFRVHAVDNGDDDVVTWAPQITYMAAEDQALPGGAGPTVKLIEPGLAQSPDDKLLEWAKAEGSLCLDSERPSFCDGNGRSLLRYRLTDNKVKGVAGDFAPLALPNPGFIVPMTGAVEFNGTIEKPATVGEAYLAYVVVPAELLATRQATHIDGVALQGVDAKDIDAKANTLRFCDADATRAGRTVTIAGTRTVSLRGSRLRLEKSDAPGTAVRAMMAGPGTYSILNGKWSEHSESICHTRKGRRTNPGKCEASGNEFDIRAGDKICLFVRNRPPQDLRDEDTAADTAGFWPIDAAGFKVGDSEPIAVRYNTELAKKPSNPAPGPADPKLADVECIDPNLGDRPTFSDGGASEPTSNPNTVQVCRSGNNKHYLLPHIQHGPARVVQVGFIRETTAGGFEKVTPQRSNGQRPTQFRARLDAPTGVTLPAQTCTWGDTQDGRGKQLFERRFAIDLRGVGPINADTSIKLLDDPAVDPVIFANRLGERVAKVRSRVFAYRGGQRRELPIKRFATFAERTGGAGLFRFDPTPLSASALAENPQNLPDGRAVHLLYDPSEPTMGLTQVLRFLRGATGTIAVSSFSESRSDASGPQSRAIQLPSTQAGFAICAAEDEDLVLESALDDRVADGARSDLNPIDALLGDAPAGDATACVALPLNPADGSLYPEEADASTKPLTRSRSNICALGTATLQLARVVSAGNFANLATEPPLSLAHRPMIDSRAVAGSGRWSPWLMPHEALTNRGQALLAIRHLIDNAPTNDADFRDPVDACAKQNLDPPLPQGNLSFGDWQRACRVAKLKAVPVEDPSKLRRLPSHQELRNLLQKYHTIGSSDPTPAEAKERLHPPALVLIPEQRYPTADPKERREIATPEKPAIATALIPTLLCNSPAVPRGPKGTSQAEGQAVATIAANSAVNPAMETKVTWALRDVQFQAATGSQPGMETFQCAIAADSAIWVTGETLSTSRYGFKDIQHGSKSEAYDAASAYSNPRFVSMPGRGVGLTAPVRRQTSEGPTQLFSLVIFQDSATKTTSTSAQDVADLNGDGYPDTIVDNSVVLTDARGGNRCGANSPWAASILCHSATDAKSPPAEKMPFGFGPVRKSFSQTQGSSFGFPSAKKTAEVQIATARAAFSSSMSGHGLPDKGQRGQESFFAWNINVDQGHSDGKRLRDVFDVNGDGLPDIVRCKDDLPKCEEASVSLNLGNKFDDPRPVSPEVMIGDRSRNVGLGLSIGWAYPLNDNSYEGGLAASSATGDITRTFVDVNGDGLPDILTIDQKEATLQAKFNTGWGFTENTPLGKVDLLKSGTFGRSETDTTTAGGAYNYMYCVWFLPPLCFHINPNMGLSGALTRQSISFRDADGDGLADFIVGDSLVQAIDSVSLPFSRASVTVVPNRLGQHGLLARVWHPTNPSALATAANLEFSYARTGKSVQDPQHRWVMARVTLRDGVTEDDAADVTDNSRNTCFAYGDGAYDRFERQFLGYARVDTVEGCAITALKPIEVAGDAWAQTIKGTRRTERRYANRSVFESGLMTLETVYDTSGGGTSVPVRSLRQSYILVDTALSTPARMVCHHMRSTSLGADDSKILGLGFVRNISLSATPGTVEIGCRSTFSTSAEAGVELFDIAPRRLTPALVQSVRETREIASGEAAVLRTAMQFQLDDLGRAKRACDLGEVATLPDRSLETRGAVCSDIAYAENVRPRFTHGATGGGTILVDQRNRIREVLISDFGDPTGSITDAADRLKDGKQPRVVRRRSAFHDPQTGMQSAICEFADPKSAIDPCSQFNRFPTTTIGLEQAARANVVMHIYRHDEFGNLDRFVGPIGSGGTYVSKAYSFDRQLALVETAERAEHCTINTTISGKPDTICLSDNVPALGKWLSYARAVDYRHAASTVSIDLNGNATFTPFDELGRVSVVYANWSKIGRNCTSCSTVDPRLIKGSDFKEIAAYTYLIPDHTVIGSTLRSPAALVARRVDRTAYGPLPNLDTLLSKTIHDQLGAAVQSMDEGSVCHQEGNTEFTTDCTRTHNLIVSGIKRKDRLGRPAQDAYATSVGLAPDATGQTLSSLIEQQIVPTDANRNTVVLDGLNRPLSVTLPDGNGFDFQYRVAKSRLTSSQGRLRHHTDMRNALCVPSAIERDVRGAIRAVVESANMTTVESQSTAAEGSTPTGQLPGLASPTTPATGLVATVTTAANQQIYACNPARGQPFALASNLSTTAYDRDALGQLVAVRLPTRGNETQTEAILVGYDLLGRRVAIDDPDRGFERIVKDGAGNSLCAYTGDRRKALALADLRLPNFDDIKTNTCADTTDSGITRLVQSKFLGTLQTAAHFKEFRFPSEERQITTVYGEATPIDQILNRVGRAYKTSDVVGDEVQTFDAIGRSVWTERDFSKLVGYDQSTAKMKLFVRDTFDTWGLHQSRTMAIKVPGKVKTGQPKPADADIQESVSYRYTPAGQLTDLEAQTGADPVVPIVSGLKYDVRGNLLSLQYATGVEGRQAFDAKSNRLTKQRTRLGVSASPNPPIYFHNLTYRYDPAGNVLAYDNAPKVAQSCEATPPGPGCLPVPTQAAKAYGLLINHSNNTFTYDQHNRIRASTKSLASVHAPPTDKEGEPDLLDDPEITKGTNLTLDYTETFAFRPTHELALMRRSEIRGVEVITPPSKGSPGGSTIKKTNASSTSVYSADALPRHAPKTITTNIDENGSKRKEETRLKFDEFGRATSSICYRTGTDGCWPDRYFVWNPDDSLRGQLSEIRRDRLSAAKRSKNLSYYDHIVSEYDANFRRTHKLLTEQHYRDQDMIEEQFVSDTLYADPQLTIIRNEGQQPRAIVHYFAGQHRLASKWVNDDRLFTYHAQLLTRNVTDIVVSKIGMPQTARLNGQQEYAAFGEILHQRETLLAGNTDGVTSGMVPGLPRYRFNAKQQDETGLQDFGARFYDNRLAIWLRPDPILRDYLDGEPSGGIYEPKNLASYGFGWGNPTNFVDTDGNFAHIAIGIGVGAVLGAGLEAGRQYMANGHIELSRVVTAGIRGGISGGLGAASGGLTMLAGGLVGAGSNVALGLGERAYHGDEQSWSSTAIDALAGGLGAAAGQYFYKPKIYEIFPLPKFADATNPAHQYSLARSAKDIINYYKGKPGFVLDHPKGNLEKFRFTSDKLTALIYRSHSDPKGMTLQLHLKGGKNVLKVDLLD